MISANANGSTTSNDFTFNTSGPPTISNVQATAITSTGATITWSTNAPADSLVDYGATTGYGSQSTIPTLVTSHSVTLTGLSPSILYHYRATSTNAYGSNQSGDFSFTTSAITTEIIIDNNDPGWTNTSPSGSWTTGTTAGVPRIGADYLYTAGVTATDEASATRKCRWTPNLPADGFYDVYVYYQIGANRTTSAPYKVVYNGGQLTSIQNQYSSTPNQGGWFLIGADLPFLAGSAGYVQLSNNAGNTALVSADAAKFVYKGSDITPPPTPSVFDDGDFTHSRNTLHAIWDCMDPESGIKKFEYRILEQGGPVVRDWTDAGTALEINASGLTLLLGKMYVFDVRATNNADLVSPVGSSNGITIFPFDVNGDGQVDGTDFDAFDLCAAGASVPYPTNVGVDCDRFDIDGDGDDDQADFGVFQLCLTGTGPIAASCLD